MKPSLQLKLSQQLTLTPQLQQAIKLLQLSTLEMNQEIERFLQENPLLERVEGDETPSGRAGLAEAPEPGAPAEASPGEAESGLPADDDVWPEAAGSYGTPGRERDDDDADAQALQAAATTLRDHLVWQLGLSQLADRDRALVRFLIEALDEDGYLSSDLEELRATLPDEAEVEAEELEIALRQLQSFDPTGIGARSPRECLGLQLRAQPASAARDLALRLVEDHLETLASRDFARLQKALGCTAEALKAAHARILALDPRPGARFAALDTRYIIPDVRVRKVRGRWKAELNPEACPRLRVNRLYADILARQRRGESGGLQAELQEARWLIKNVQQRFDTIARVAQAIVERQQQFFEHGEVAMRPLVLREIAEQIGLHESTVSRVTSQKYMATPRGIFELKYFFGSHVATDSGGACSATAIRALIKQLIGAEDGRKPLSDSQISEILGRQGIVVARRTVAKYREALNIPPVNLRKTL